MPQAAVTTLSADSHEKISPMYLQIYCTRVAIQGWQINLNYEKTH